MSITITMSITMSSTITMSIIYVYYSYGGKKQFQGLKYHHKCISSKQS